MKINNAACKKSFFEKKPAAKIAAGPINKKQKSLQIIQSGR